MVTGAAVSLISTGAAMVDGFEDSMSPRKPSAPSMRSKCSISAWSWPTAPSSALPDMLLVPRLLWPCGDWRKGSVGQIQRERERGREDTHEGGVALEDRVGQLDAALFTRWLPTLSGSLKPRKKRR